jgi:hypothetical protein
MIQIKPSLETILEFKYLLELHELTTHWIHSIYYQAESPISRGLENKKNLLSEFVFKLQLFNDPSLLYHILDDTAGSKLLKNEHSIQILQTWILNELTLNNTNTRIIPHLQNLSWQLGYRHAERKHTDRSYTVEEIFYALQSTYFCRHTQLTKRKTQHLVQTFLSHCPHTIVSHTQIHLPQLLCSMHQAWIKGYTYYLNYHVHTQFTSHLNAPCLMELKFFCNP